MKKTKKLLKLQLGQLIKTAAFTLALVFSLWLFAGSFSIVSHAESAGRIISSDGARARSSASTGSDVVASYAVNEVISIRSQVEASDGYTWYEIHVDDQRLGYIRSDLVEITDGSTPPTSTQVAPSTSAPDNNGTNNSGTANNTIPSNVTELNPVSAVVANGGNSGVRIRSNPSTRSGEIITSVQNGLALTVIGQADSQDADQYVWWYVNFISNGTQVTGFIRSDYVELSEEPAPYTEPEDEPEPADDVENTPEPVVTKDYDTVYEDGSWRLMIYTTDPPGYYDINELLQMVSNNQEVYDQLQETIKTQKITIVILVILLVAAAGAVGFLVFKIKDMTDSAYFNEVESETLLRRSAQGGQRVTHNVGTERRGPSQGQRPAGARPAGAPQGQRPAGAPQGQRPAGARPAGAPQGQRPAGAPQGQRPAGAPQGQRPAGAPQGQRPAGAPQGQRPAGASQGQRPSGASQSAGRPQPKNFMADDEFEFEFLNYDGDDQQ